MPKSDYLLREGGKVAKPIPYDLKMIEDFIEHLTWEVRASHLENSVAAKTGKACKVNPELAEQIEKHIRKRGRTLLCGLVFDKEGATTEEVESVGRAIGEGRARVRQEQLDALETLAGLFKEAMRVGAIPIKYGSIPAQEIKVTDYLEDDEEDD